jgi:hypothetical protein
MRLVLFIFLPYGRKKYVRRTVMKEKLFSTVILALVLAMAFIGCDNGTTDDDPEETWTDATSSYPILEADGVPELTVVAEVSSLGNTRIKLSGTIEAAVSYDTEDNTATSWWNINYEPGVGGSTPADGIYSAAVFDGFFPEDASGKVLAVKVTNDAFRYYTGYPNATGPLTKPSTANEQSIYIPAQGAATRWRLYNAGDIPDGDWLGVLLWSGADPKTITIELQEFASFDPDADYTVLKRVTIDYSDVDFDE